MSESDDLINKLTDDIPTDGKFDFSSSSSSEDDFNALLDNFIQSELANIEEEKETTRIMLDEPKPEPIPETASDEEVADSLDLSEQKLYMAYRNYVESIEAIAREHELRVPTFHIKAQTLYPKYTPGLGNLISIDVLQGWDTMFDAFS